MSGLRSVRAALVIAIAWAIPWTVAGVVLNVFAGRRDLFQYATADIIRTVLIFAAAWALLGALNGLFFSLLLSTVGKRWRGGLDGLRVAALGAAAGSILPIAFFAVLVPRDFITYHGAPVVALAVVVLGAALGGMLGIATFAAARHEALDR
jgi:hypothetical protein